MKEQSHIIPRYDGHTDTKTCKIFLQAMSLDPGEDMYPANRANVYLKLSKWAEAEKDCTDAVKLDPKASKVMRE